MAQAIDDKLNSNPVKIVGADNTTQAETNIAKVSANQDIGVSDIVDNGGVNGPISVSTSAVAVRVGGANLANRKSLTFHNNGTATLYWGYSAAVTATNGHPIMRNQFVTGNWGPNTTIYIIAASGTHDVRVTEGA